MQFICDSVCPKLWQDLVIFFFFKYNCYFYNPTSTGSVQCCPKSDYLRFPSDKNKILQTSTLGKLLNQCSAFVCFIAIGCSGNSSTASGELACQHMVCSKCPLTTVPVSDICMFTGKTSDQLSTPQIWIGFVLMDLSVTMRRYQDSLSCCHFLQCPCASSRLCALFP